MFLTAVGSAGSVSNGLSKLIAATFIDNSN